MIETAEHRLHPEEVDELPEYRSVSGVAIFGLLLALLSPLALARMVLIALPVAAMLLCLIALVRIRRSEGRLVGRLPAFVGLGVATLFAAAAPAQVVAWNRSLHARATPVALAWLETLQQRQPHKAHQFTKPDVTRRPLTDALWTYYQGDPAARRELETFVNDPEHPEVKFLLTLGKDAVVRFYEPYAAVTASANSQLITQLFSVTFNSAQGRTSFFISVIVQRREIAAGGGEQWQIVSHSGGVNPRQMVY